MSKSRQTEDRLKFRSITPEIVHITLPTRNELAQTLIRFQEHYESPFPDIRGKIFTLGMVRAKGGRKKPGVASYEGGKHYTAEWSGYNFPGSTLDPFIKGLFDPLTSIEQDIVEALRYRQDRFYVIGTYGDDDPGDTLNHEIAHALYYVNADYKAAVDSVLAPMDLAGIKQMLRDWGYCEEVLDDEVQAYIGPDYAWFKENKTDDITKYKIPNYDAESKLLNDIRAVHFKPSK